MIQLIHVNAYVLTTFERLLPSNWIFALQVNRIRFLAADAFKGYGHTPADEFGKIRCEPLHVFPMWVNSKFFPDECPKVYCSKNAHTQPPPQTHLTFMCFFSMEHKSSKPILFLLLFILFATCTWPFCCCCLAGCQTPLWWRNNQWRNICIFTFSTFSVWHKVIIGMRDAHAQMSVFEPGGRNFELCIQIPLIDW